MKIIRTKAAKEIETRKGGYVLWSRDISRMRHPAVAKLQEECLEVCQEIRDKETSKKNNEDLIEEMADVFQVMLGIASLYGIDFQDVVTFMDAKADEKGGFWDSELGMAFYLNRGEK